MIDLAIEAADRAVAEMIEAVGEPPNEALGALIRDTAIAAARLAIDGPVEAGAPVRLPAPDDTYNHAADMPMMGWEPSREGGPPYYVEFIPNGSHGQIELEHDGKRLTPMTDSQAEALGAALIAAARLNRAETQVPVEPVQRVWLVETSDEYDDGYHVAAVYTDPELAKRARDIYRMHSDTSAYLDEGGRAVTHTLPEEPKRHTVWHTSHRGLRDGFLDVWSTQETRAPKCEPSMNGEYFCFSGTSRKKVVKAALRDIEKARKSGDAAWLVAHLDGPPEVRDLSPD